MQIWVFVIVWGKGPVTEKDVPNYTQLSVHCGVVFWPPQKSNLEYSLSRIHTLYLRKILKDHNYMKYYWTTVTTMG